jgi:hypothetical protein
MVVAIPYFIWLNSYETSYMIHHFLEEFFRISAMLQIYYFSWQLCDIT